jgi:hypothetical protein
LAASNTKIVALPPISAGEARHRRGLRPHHLVVVQGDHGVGIGLRERQCQYPKIDLDVGARLGGEFLGEHRVGGRHDSGRGQDHQEGGESDCPGRKTASQPPVGHPCCYAVALEIHPPIRAAYI